MRVILAGGSGFLGQALAGRLRTEGHTVQVLTRTPRPDVTTDIGWDPTGEPGPWSAALDGAGAVVNLAGQSLADGRWTDARKQALVDSRLQPTRSLVAAIRSVATPPVLISASAVGYYGARGDEPVTEDAPPGDDYLSRLGVQWESAASAASATTRVAIVRTGLVLHPDGGALKSMLLPFRLGLGGRLGSGRQYWPWIHLDDWIALVVWLVGEPRADGPFNLTAPVPVTNAAFTRALGRVLRRPTLLPAPSFALKLVLGEFAEFLVTGQRAVPARAEALGFQFRFRELEPALRDLLAQPSAH